MSRMARDWRGSLNCLPGDYGILDYVSSSVLSWIQSFFSLGDFVHPITTFASGLCKRAEAFSVSSERLGGTIEDGHLIEGDLLWTTREKFWIQIMRISALQ